MVEQDYQVFIGNLGIGMVAFSIFKEKDG